MRQTKLSQFLNDAKSGLRITRGNSDLPKQEPKVESESESLSDEQQEKSDNPPKIKKIHHMTLKALERKQKLAELGIVDPKQQDSTPKIPKKRGRPKGYQVKKNEDKEDFIINEEKQVQALQIDKKQMILRKRDNNKRFVEQDSMQIQEESEKQQSIKQPEVIIKPVIQPKFQEIVATSAPKKRGRKKKIQPEIIPNPQVPNLPKIFTVPKSQTYENYLKFYNKIIEETKQKKEPQIPLIFDKFMNPQQYDNLLKKIK